jgi:hypothetical protein
VEARLQARRQLGDRLAWPATLAAFVDRVVVGDDVVLVRPISGDSAVLQVVDGRSTDVAVVPLTGFIGCKPGGCLWLFNDDLVPGLLLLDPESLAALIRSARQ